MSEANFASILDRPANSIERPKPLPVGSYLCLVSGQPRHDKSREKQTPFVEFTLVPREALDDVNEEDLAAALTMGDSTIALADKKIQATFYITEANVYRLREFVEHCGVDIDGRSLGACLDECINCEVIAKLRHEPDNRDKSINVARFAASAPAKD